MDYDLDLIPLICFVHFDKGEGTDPEAGKRRRPGPSLSSVPLQTAYSEGGTPQRLSYWTAAQELKNSM